MTFTKSALLIASAFPLLIVPAAANAQTGTPTSGIVACPTQGELEQSIGSEGSIMPDACTTLEINSLTSDNGELCLIDFGQDQGFLGQLRDAAFPTQWWVACDDLIGATAQ